MKTKNLRRRIIRIALFSTLIPMSSLLTSLPESYAQDAPSKGSLSLVEANRPEQPRATPVTRDAMKQYLEDLKHRTPRIPLPELSDEEKKQELESPRPFGYETRLRNQYLSGAPNAYLTFGGSPVGGFPNLQGTNATSRQNPQDPALTLDYAFKTRMFWIAARANNCQYCLGHQESKLLAAGMDEDQIAALDSDWEIFPEKEQAAFNLAKRLTLEPHLLAPQDIDACKEFFSDLQIIEMLGSIAGNNAINRWKEGAGVPQIRDGGNFSSGRGPSHESYLTKTSEKFAKLRSRIVRFDPKSVSLNGSAQTTCKRPELLKGEEMMKRILEAETRTPRLPLLEEDATRNVLGELAVEGPLPQWQRLLAHFPVAGKRLIDGVLSSKKSDELSSELQAKIDWVTSRQDGAWYLTALALKDLKSQHMDGQIDALDSDLSKANVLPDAREQALLLVAKNLSASPIVLTDAQVNNAISIAGPKAVTQVINYTCYRAALNRITEGAGLSLR